MAITKLVLLFLFLCSSAWAQDYELSYLLVRASDGKSLHSLDESKLRVPASALKIVTAAAALEQLGAEHRFHTRVLSNEPVSSGTVDRLALQGEADPELDSQALQSLVDQLWTRGLRKVSGDLLIDPGPYSFPPYGSGWAWDDAGTSYSPEISGLNLNGGVWPWSALSSNTRIVVKEELPKGYWLVPGRSGIVTGKEHPTQVSPPESALRTGQEFLRLLRLKGIRVEGRVRKGPPLSLSLADQRSRPLRSLLKSALGRSDNLALELLYRAGGQKPPSCLAEESFRQADGSGLSRYNLISCRQLVEVLRTHPELRDLLPVPGEGTLGKRFLGSLARQHVAAKTGTLSNTSALTGYLFPGTEKECYFAILINGHIDSTSKRKKIEDDLVERWVLEIAYPYVLSDQL